ncbi:glycoside hydrolase family 5 protein [[Candida] arabinofermentans NRRL YB-2248]|uniref:Glycoside hydrolase family 5 protein n=1 Tax=[Candida] arabinofermentans NRRL YB-2248 TaxID=983967 RepID=A0A1E4T5K8_9ASCO|nr:glycoside hydrolase family 5 protein [[Candida] arabinofermentans NRRL YB-2248]
MFDPKVAYHEKHQIKKSTVAELTSVLETQHLVTDKLGNIIEEDTHRRVLLRGINLDSSAKMPEKPFQATYSNPESCGFYEAADDVSFVGKPFPLEDAYEHLTRIKLWGYNTIRYVITWEAIEHKGPGIYDDDFVDYTVKLLKKIDEIGGLYVFIDPHQDVWSRFSGGSGAPLWTLYAAGLEPKHFSETEAALVHNFSVDPQEYPKMVWASNYYRLAAEVMFTMFFSGKIFTPKCIIDGVNIQDYLQDHFINAIRYFMTGVKLRAPELFNKTLMALETMNEPNSGLYGFRDLNLYPLSQELKLNTCPKPIESMRLGMGMPQTVDIYGLSVFGPKKQGSTTVDPKGKRAWIRNDKMDKHYGFKRDPKWKLGTCVFAQHGVWDTETGDLLNPNYFNEHPITGEPLDKETFINTDFVSYWAKYRAMSKSIDPELYIIMQHPVFEIPPDLKGTDLVDRRTIVAQHYYDGMSLMFKTWNRKYNVDTLGIMRGKYLNPVFGLVFGEANIRKSIRSQMAQLKEEAQFAVGSDIPVIITETGMPFDMDDKKAFENGDYSSQESANDALGFALEGSHMHSTYWCYNSQNNHKWGDNWNLEDFSLFSKDDINEHKVEYSMGSSNYAESQLGTYMEWINNSSSTVGEPHHNKKNEHKEHTYEVDDLELETKIISLLNGTRVSNAIVRPYPVTVNGCVTECEFSLADKSFSITIDTSIEASSVRPSTSKPTIIYLPDLHFQPGQFEITVSNGTTIYKHNRLLQVIEWYHDTLGDAITLSVSSYSNMQNDGSWSIDDWDSLKVLACGYM